jgi:hypothetical protein
MKIIRSISLTVDVAQDNDLPRVLDVLARAAAGLLLEGIDTRIHSFQFDDSDVDAD